MEANDGTKWVIQNSAKITGYASRLQKNAPYEAKDYMQEAYIASLKAYKRVPDTSNELFRRTFWGIFKQAIIEIVPKPDMTDSKRRVRSNESMSIPSYACVSDDNVLHSIQETKEHEVDFCKFFFMWVRPALSDQESIVFHLRFGLGTEGVLPENEIAEKIGVSRRRVRTLLKNSIYKIAKLSEETDAKKILLVMIKTMKESF